MWGSLSVSSPYIVEPDCRADSKIWSDHHHPSASHFHFPGASQQPHTSRQCSRWVSLQDWESPLTPLPPAPTGNQDADVHGRQGTQGRDDNSWPANRSKEVQERSSIRMTSKQTPCQVGEHPYGAPYNVSPALTPESTLPQCGGGTRAPPKDPLKNVTNYKSTRWRKDLEHVLKAYYKHHFASFKEAEWTKLKDKFFQHLGQHQDEWKSIKENHPLKYMPYMEKHYHTTTSIKLKGLSDFTGWIKCGSYYHAVVARKGQLHKCPHLVGVELPRWPQVTPSKSR